MPTPVDSWLPEPESAPAAAEQAVLILQGRGELTVILNARQVLVEGTSGGVVVGPQCKVFQTSTLAVQYYQQLLVQQMENGWQLSVAGPVAARLMELPAVRTAVQQQLPRRRETRQQQPPVAESVPVAAQEILQRTTATTTPAPPPANPLLRLGAKRKLRR